MNVCVSLYEPGAVVIHPYELAVFQSHASQNAPSLVSFHSVIPF